MSAFHREFPTKPVHFTEGSVFGIWGAGDLIQRLRHDASSYNAWVSILDDQGRPNNGPFPATHAILKLHSNTLRIEEILEFHAYGQFMKFLPRGSVRVHSTPGTKDFDHVTFLTPAGHWVMVAVNTTREPRDFTVREAAGRSFSASLRPRSVATYRWPVE
jgi:O-glycosyl hydrolase